MTLCSSFSISAQDCVSDAIDRYGKFDSYSVRVINESKIIGGKEKILYEFCRDGDTLRTCEPFVAPEDYFWRTNNVLAIVAGVVKTNNTVYPEPRGDGYCARIETHIEEVKALGLVNMEVVCQGAMFIGRLVEPIRDTKNPMGKVFYGIPFSGRPKALVFDYKAEVGHTTIRGTGFSKMKSMGYPDYPEIAVILQKRWEDEDGNIHALRVGTGMERVRRNITEWKDCHRLELKYGDITKDASYEDYMGLNNDPSRAFHAINSRGRNVVVHEEGWASPEEIPNFIIIKFLSSCNEAFYGGVGNILWIDNVHLEM